ncbi:MAG: UDP-N-acetylglucosamine 1-carboxyvinyltransferase [Candidatus Taylorbacteria bacterium]|nr:UDP-N-acetylglucosamine 1-carboxyvinyltransferase [Candidatus Taylorbacteria bacterium]
MQKKALKIEESPKTLDFTIVGGHKLKGEIEIKKSKNASVAVLCASLLNAGTTTLKKIPKIEEVFRILEVFESIGVKTEWKNEDLVINVGKINLKNINRDSAEKTRTVIMMIGPLIHLFKKFEIPNAGGCKLGSRIVSPHFYALENFGVSIETESDKYIIKNKKLRPSEFVLYEMGDTVTENALMAASKIDGVSTIKFASSNYMVQDLCHFLETLGVKIEGIGTSTLIIHGVKEVNRDVTFEISEDPIEAMFFFTSAIVTKSSILIKKCPIDFLELELLKLKMMGFKYRQSKVYKGENGFVNLVDIQTEPSNLKALPEKIHAIPYPGINMDNLPFFAVIATQAEGETFIHDWVYENRAIYYTELEKLGASIILADPHRVYIKGQTKLRAADMVTPPALRPAAIILIGMLAAKGTSILRNVYSISRGYEDLADRLNKLGAKISVS